MTEHNEEARWRAQDKAVRAGAGHDAVRVAGEMLAFVEPSVSVGTGAVESIPHGKMEEVCFKLRQEGWKPQQIAARFGMKSQAVSGAIARARREAGIPPITNANATFGRAAVQ